MTYATLKSDAASWLQRDDMTAVIPTLVRYATAAFNRELDRAPVPEMESRDTSQLTTEYSALPSDLLRVRAVVRSDGKELRYVTPQEMDEYEAQGVAPEPQVYTLEDMQLRVYPAPSVSSPVDVTLSYYERIASLTLDTDSNWLLSGYPDLYLLGTLAQARMWLHDDPRLPTVVAMYDKALAQLKSRTLTTPGMAVSRQTDIPPTYGTFDIVRGF